MKKTILTSFLGIILFSCAFSQVSPFKLTGRVTDISGMPLAFKTVHIYADSVTGYNYNDYAITDSNGYYSKTIAPPSGTLYKFSAYVLDCKNLAVWQYFQNNLTTVTENFVICTVSCNAQFYYSFKGTKYSYDFIDQSTGSITSWYWSFGDGTYSTLQNPSHTFSTTGTYTVCLYITGSGGCSDSFCVPIYTFDSTTNNCKTYFDNYIDSNLTVSFRGYAFDSTRSYTYFWDFGDSSTSTLQNPVHTYSSASIWHVCLTATGIDKSNDTCISQYCKNVDLRTTTNYYTITGMISCTGYSVDKSKVYLIYFNPKDSTLTAVDTTYSMDSSGISFYYFGNVPAGKYLVKAALTSGSTNYSFCMPTYYGNVLFWNLATYVYVSPSNPYVAANIQLVTGINPGGPGFIGGKTSMGANIMISPGDPVPAIEMLLLDNSTGLPVSCKYSDLAGGFSFGSLPFGTYKVYAELAGVTTDPAIITINAGKPSVSNVKVIIGTKIITSLFDDQISGIIKGIGNLYPNPASDQITLEVNLFKSAAIDISISNLTGQLVYHSNLKYQVGSNNIQVNISDLSSGLYNFILKTEDGGFRAFQFMVK